MLSLLVMGWRNLWRNRRRTLINMSAACFGLFLVLVYQALIAGMLSEAKGELDSSGMGHVELTAPGYRQRKVLSTHLGEPKELLSRLELPEGAQVGARVLARGLVTSAHGGQGVAVQGVDPADEAKLSSFFGDVRKGEPLQEGDLQGVLIGEKLAERLKLQVGNKVRLMVQRADGEMGADLFRVRGIFHSIAAPISKGQIFITSKAAQELLGLGPVAHQVVIQLPRAEQAGPLAQTLRAKLGPSVEVLTYAELLPVLGLMEKLIDKVLLAIAAFVYLLVGLGILNTMLMSVLERTREFGVMRALGTRPSRVVALVLAEAFWIATLSVTVGLTLGLWLTYVGSERALVDFSQTAGESVEYAGAYLKTAFRMEFSPGAGLRAAALVYVVTLLVGLYPAYLIAKKQPAEALRSS